MTTPRKNGYENGQSTRDEKASPSNKRGAVVGTSQDAAAATQPGDRNTRNEPEKTSLSQTKDVVLETSAVTAPSTLLGRATPEFHTHVESANACVGTLPQSVEDKADVGVHLSSSAVQVFLPFLVAGFGSVVAGILLDEVKDWRVFVNVRELFVLIPPLLGLNGNLEQTLVARLGTQANLGHMNSLRTSLDSLLANVALLQCQSTVASTVACIFATFKGLVLNADFEYSHVGIIFASALASVNTSSLILCTLMTAVVVLSAKCNKNPDNIAPAIAASSGDLTTLLVLSFSASTFLDHPGLSVVVIVIAVMLLPLWIALAWRNSMSKEVLRVGWLPIIAALTVSSFGGYILDYAVIQFPPIALHLSTVNALGGNLASVFSCSLSSYLSRVTTMGQLPPGEGVCIGPLQMYYGSSPMAHMAIVLLGAVVPGQTLFAVLSKVMRFGYISMSLFFYVVYLSATVLQVVALLYMGRLMVYALWKLRIDPDNAAIPFLTGCGDLLGTGFLTIGYEILALAKDDSEDLQQELQALRHSRPPSFSTPAAAPWGHLNKTFQWA